MAWIWLHNQKLLNNHNGKELPPEWALYRFWAPFKCQFGDTIDEATRHAFLCYLLPWEVKPVAIQTDIG